MHERQTLPNFCLIRVFLMFQRWHRVKAGSRAVIAQLRSHCVSAAVLSCVSARAYHPCWAHILRRALLFVFLLELRAALPHWCARAHLVRHVSDCRTVGWLQKLLLPAVFFCATCCLQHCLPLAMLFESYMRLSSVGCFSSGLHACVCSCVVCM